MDKKILKWNFVFQYGWVLTNLFNSILLLPLYIKNIDASTLGVWLATSSILGWMTLVDPGVGEVLQQKIAELCGKKENEEIGRTIASGLFASGFILLLSVVAGFVFYFSLGVIINKDVSQYPHLAMALILTVIATGMSLVSFSISGINQGLYNSAQVAVFSLSANFLFLFVNLLFLYLGFGVMSIAFANLCRALFINIFNIGSMLRLLKKQEIKIVFHKAHFKRFIRIFSFTSASKIISGLSYSVDMIVLARFIPPGMITTYEINKRPVNLTNTLIGRHSVALMPLISHAKGAGNKTAIVTLINKHFKFYTYAALFAAFVFCLNYKDLISLWTGEGHYIGNTNLYLLVASSFIALLCYFMSNVGYALGDIKKNSLFGIVRNIVYGVLMFFAAKYYGITGTLALALVLTLVADSFFYAYRVYKLGYLEASLLKSTINTWLIIVPVSLLAIWGCKMVIESIFPATMYFGKLLVSSGTFATFYIALVLLVDSEMRNNAKQLTSKFVLTPLYKLIRA